MLQLRIQAQPCGRLCIPRLWSIIFICPKSKFFIGIIDYVTSLNPGSALWYVMPQLWYWLVPSYTKWVNTHWQIRKPESWHGLLSTQQIWVLYSIIFRTDLHYIGVNIGVILRSTLRTPSLSGSVPFYALGHCRPKFGLYLRREFQSKCNVVEKW